MLDNWSTKPFSICFFLLFVSLELYATGVSREAILPYHDGVEPHHELKTIIDYDDLANSLEIAPVETNSSQFASFMVGLHKADASGKAKRAKRIVEKALEVGNYIDVLTGGDLLTMPIIKEQQVGENTVQIVFNEATIYPTFAQIDVYIKIETPQVDFNGNPVVLYFGAEDIWFSQEKGIIKGSVGLLADYAISFGGDNQAGIYLKAMERTQTAGEGTPNNPLDDEYDYTGTYINFDCDGFREMGVGGKIYLSEDWVLPADEFGNIITTTNDSQSSIPRVKAEFQLHIQDWSDLMVTASVDHFVLTEYQDMSFFIGDATIDLSSIRNPEGIPESYGVPPNLWEGLYIDAISITLPQQFKRSTESFASGTHGTDPDTGVTPPPPPTERIKVAARHLLIDAYGVTGSFNITGEAPLIGGAIMDGEWGWSLDEIGIEVTQSALTSFEFAGDIGVPILSKDGPLEYEGYYNVSTSAFKIDITDNLEEPKSFPIWNVAQANITAVYYSFEDTGSEFVPSIGFDGSLQIGNPSDYINSPTGSIVKMPKLDFTKLTFTTKSPYISYEKLMISGGGSKVAGFPVTVTNPGLGSSGSDPDIKRLSFDIVINLMDPTDGGVSAEGSLAILGKYNRDANGVRRWEYHGLDFEGAQITIALPQFYASGSLDIFEDDPVYGNGFSANLDAGLIGNNLQNGDLESAKYRLQMMSIFGSTEGYRYFLVDGMLGFESTPIPIAPPFYLTGFGGGAFHHMKPDRYVESPDDNTTVNAGTGQSLSGIIYKPTKATKFGFKFSTAFATKGDLMSGLLTCIVRFDQNMALQNIMFWGTADLFKQSGPGDMERKNPAENIPNNVATTAEIQQQGDEELANNNDEEGTGIKAKVGIAFDFENDYFHAFAEVSIKKANVIDGVGTLDLFISKEKWHFYLGGYHTSNPESTTTTIDFFNSDQEIVLEPISLSINYGSAHVSANAYFLTGNDLPGPPPPHPSVIEFFGNNGEDAGEGNRHLMTCAERGLSPASGTGVAFGAHAEFDIYKRLKGWFGSCVAGLKFDLAGMGGFDLALLKYGSDVSCGDGTNPMGINGFRATGRFYAFIGIQGGNVTCIPLPHLGIGLKAEFDVPNPSYIDGTVILDFIKRYRKTFKVGEKCGHPCEAP